MNKHPEKYKFAWISDVLLIFLIIGFSAVHLIYIGPQYCAALPLLLKVWKGIFELLISIF